MTQLLAELIEIPERSAQEDFVLKLVDGVKSDRAGRTVDDYVISESIKARLDQALSLIQGALGIEVEGGTARVARSPSPGTGCYLDGSFGSGKSHFMAFLHRLLTGDPKALGREELHDLVATHGPWLKDRRFLLVPCHMIGADATEQRIYEGYVQAIRTSHPEAGLPVLFRDDRIVGLLQTMRETGETGLLDRLNAAAGSGTDDEWGDFGDTGGWTAERLGRALEAPSADADRQQLVLTATERILQGLEGDTKWVPIGDGLLRMTNHAKGLGYDGVVLFLDELILWLAGRSGDLPFLQREIEKILQLVEGHRTADRALPIVSFIARQKRLGELVGRTAIGAELQAIEDQLTHHEGRFSSVRLELMDLPLVASRRLLRPRSDAARQELDAHFARLAADDRALRTLIGSEGDRESFRQVYPFSPVLVKALVAASSLLQRDRTALKAMQQLLVQRRGTLQVGEVIPIGDLWSVVGSGREAINTATQDLFRVANELRRQKFMPRIEDDRGVTEDAVGRIDASDPKARAFTMDRRIVDTLLLAAIVPGVPELQDLTPDRIARLNHGSIRSPIPGGDAGIVLQRLRAWANEIPELQLGEDSANPTVRLQLDSLDTERILHNADAYDQQGARVGLVRRVIREQLEVDAAGDRPVVRVPWKGVDREVEIVFSNVSEMTARSLQHAGPGWKVVIDEPLDGRPPIEADQADREVIERFKREAEQDPSIGGRTLVWRPRFLGQRAQADLGKLVRLEGVLRSDTTFQDATPHLSEEDRHRARALLEGQRKTLRTTLEALLKVAYGLGQDPDMKARLDESVEIERPFESLDPSFEPRTPADGRSLRKGLEAVLEQGFEHVFPAAPDWPDDVKRADAAKVVGLVRTALADAQHRALMDDGAKRRIGQRIAIPLGLAAPGEVFHPNDRWRQRFTRAADAEGVRLEDGVSVGQLRGWIDHDGATGLPDLWRDVVIIAFAEGSEYQVARAGQPLESLEPGRLQTDDVLKPVPMPTTEAWDQAKEVAGRALGVAFEGMFLSAAFMESLQGRVLAAIADAAGVEPAERTDRRRVFPRMRARLEDLKRALASRGATSGPRVHDVDAALELVDRLESAASARETVEALAAYDPTSPSSDTSAGYTLKQCMADLKALQDENAWKLLAGATALGTEAARGLQADVEAVLQGQAHERQLATELPGLVSRATSLLVSRDGGGAGAGGGGGVGPGPGVGPGAGTGAGAGPGTATATVHGSVRIAPGASLDEVQRAIEAFRREHPEAEIEVSWRTVGEGGT